MLTASLVKVTREGEVMGPKFKLTYHGRTDHMFQRLYWQPTPQLTAAGWPRRRRLAVDGGDAGEGQARAAAQRRQLRRPHAASHLQTVRGCRNRLRFAADLTLVQASVMLRHRG